MPFAVKNLVDIAGLLTRAGSKINRERAPAARDAALVRRLEDAGAVLVGGLNLANRVAAGLGYEGTIEQPPATVVVREDLDASPMLSILAKAKPTLEGRTVGCLVADGSDPTLIATRKAEVDKLGAKMKVIAPKIGGAKGKGGAMIPADFQLAGGPSMLFDAILLALSKDGAAMLANEPWPSCMTPSRISR